MTVLDSSGSHAQEGPDAPDARRGRSAMRGRVAVAVLSHPILDAYAGYVPPILGLLQVRCELTEWQAAFLLAVGPLVSGASQPACAWIADHTDSRLLGAVGMAVAAAALSSVGLASSFAELLVLFVVGLLGVGAYHPVAAAAVGEIARARRSAAVTIFFVAGMIGATLGPFLSSRLTAIEPGGFTLLGWTMVPGIAFALVLHLAIRRVPHKAAPQAERAVDDDVRRRWRAVGVLFVGNAMRYFVNIALLYLFVRWAEHLVSVAEPRLDRDGVARAGALHAGALTALMMLGMGVGGFVAGFRIRAGRERGAFVLLPLLVAPAIALFPVAGHGTGYPLAVAAGIGYGALIPVSIALAQRMLPHRTSLASSLVMGSAWCVAATAPPIMQWLLAEQGLGACFGTVAAVLACSGVVGVLLPRLES